MTYYLYHIPGKKIGVTTNLEERVHKQQGYYPGEYEIIETSDDIDFISEGERIMQKFYKYRVDDIPYNKLNFNKNKHKMNINITEQTTTFPCPVDKLKGQLMDNLDMTWETEHGSFVLTQNTINWIMSNAKQSMYNRDRCYIYNKAFARYYDNNDPYSNIEPIVKQEEKPKDMYDGKTISGALSPTGVQAKHKKESDSNYFDLIRAWADERGLYEKGDPKTQYIKLMEEAGELGRAILKEDLEQGIDAVGDMVVVLTNFSELMGVSIEECIVKAYNEIKDRTGKMDNGTFKKD